MSWKQPCSRGRLADLSNRLGHLEGADGVHVGGNNGNAVVIVLGVAEQERSVEIDLRSVRAQDHAVSQADRPSTAYLRPALEGAPLGAHEHVLEVQLHIRVHPRHGYTCTVSLVPRLVRGR